jgi:hypothetical protein
MFRVRIRDPFFATLIGGAYVRADRAWSIAVLTVLVTLVPLAHASPTDPMWIAGIYDAADADDLVLTGSALESSVAGDLNGAFRVSGPAVLTADDRATRSSAVSWLVPHLGIPSRSNTHAPSARSGPCGIRS